MDESESLAFAEPYLQMTCIDPAPGTDPAILAEFSRYYTEVHTPDVVRNNPGMRRAYRYELSIADAKGAFGPKWLSVYEWSSRHGAQVFAVRAEDPAGSWRPDYLPEPPIWTAIGRGPRQWGRLMCNKLGESGPSRSAPVAVVMEGIDLPEGATEVDAEAFRSAGLDQHPLAVGGVTYSRVVRYEFEHLGTKPRPASGMPRYVNIYEADAATAAMLDQGVVTPDPTAGLPIAERQRVAWRHVYRRISTCIYPGARYAARML